MTHILKSYTFLFALFLFSPFTQANDYLDREEFQSLLKEMESEYDIKNDYLIDLFSDVEQQQSILEAIARPAEKTLTWKEYRAIFINQQRIDGGIKFWKKHRDTLNRANDIFKVPPEIIVAIIGVETRYGGNKGSYRVIDALATLGFDYPPRSKFFSKELKKFILLEDYAGIDLKTAKGSYAGAMGYGQFIPSSYHAYAVDFNNDELIDIVNDPVDAIGSVANYFKRHGWKQGKPVASRGYLAKNKEDKNLTDILEAKSLKPVLKVKNIEKAGLKTSEAVDSSGKATAFKFQGMEGDEYWIGLENFYVITRYNHSKLYAMAVYQLSQQIKMKMDQEVSLR